MPGHEPEPGGHPTDYSVGHPECTDPRVFRLPMQLSVVYYEGATAKVCPIEAAKLQSLSRAPCVLVTGRSALQNTEL